MVTFEILAARNGDLSWLLIMVVIIIINAISSAVKQNKKKQEQANKFSLPKNNRYTTQMIRPVLPKPQQNYQQDQQQIEPQFQSMYQQQLEMRRMMLAKQRQEMAMKAKKAERLQRKDDILAKRQERIEQAKAYNIQKMLIQRKEPTKQAAMEASVACDIYNLNSEDMRSAVILSEILNQPLALR